MTDVVFIDGLRRQSLYRHAAEETLLNELESAKEGEVYKKVIVFEDVSFIGEMN